MQQVSTKASKQFITTNDLRRMGVTVDTIKPGDGTNYPRQGQRLTMHYTGTLKSNGSKFDSSHDRGRPFQFVIGIGQVIRGWDEVSFVERLIFILIFIFHMSFYSSNPFNFAL
mmetsp:Transcript_7717/g.11035  ORF Transcript_7717/g.11035 Transcript_7717/m.11035 type:complete len:113 (-) Transcript_7717:346-684(-)